MIDEEKLKEYIKRKCYDLFNLKSIYENTKDDFCKYADSIKTNSNFWIGIVDKSAVNLKNSYNNYETNRFNLHQLCWVLGDEYKQIYKDILKEE